MKKTLILLLCLWMTGCGEAKVAEQYATKMNAILATYRMQIDRKIRAEQQSYVELAKAYDVANVNNLAEELLITRNQQATALVDEITSAANITATTILDRLQAYGEVDFAQAEQVFTREADAYRQALAGIEDLTVEQARLEKLSGMLTTLAKPRTNIEQLKMLGQFGCEVNRNYKLLDVGKEIETLTPQLTSAKATVTSLTAQMAAETDAEKKKVLADKLTAASAKVTSLDKANTAATKEKTLLLKPCE